MDSEPKSVQQISDPFWAKFPQAAYSFIDWLCVTWKNFEVAYGVDDLPEKGSKERSWMQSLGDHPNLGTGWKVETAEKHRLKRVKWSLFFQE